MRTVSRDAEVKMLEMLSSLRESPMGWRMAYLRLSGLSERYRSVYQTQIALNMMLDFLRVGDGSIFLLSDHDVIIICKSVSRVQLEKMVFRLRYLFSDDPMAYNEDGQENPEFCELHDLEADWDMVETLANFKMAATTKPQVKPVKSKERGPARGGLERKLTPQKLMGLEKELEYADLNTVLRRQPVCGVTDKETKRFFDEFYINIAHLKKLLNVQEVDVFSNTWLFNYLTQILDHKMLELLQRKPAHYFDTPISLNLNVETLLSEHFAKFDTLLKPALKVSIIVELQLGNIFNDMQAFQAARRTLQQSGYRICLDGLSEDSLPQIDRQKLGFDLAKLYWNPDLANMPQNSVNSSMNKELHQAIARTGPSRIILCRCDNRHAIDYGRKLGINLFQGRYIDHLLDPMAKVMN